MKDLTKYINEELKPRLYDNITSIFPDMRFTKSGSRWISQYHIDGTEGTGYKKDRSVITEKLPYRMFDQTRQESEDLITLYQKHNNIGEVWEAVNELCKKVGIPEPEYTQEAKERYRKSEQRRNAMEESAKRQKAALFSPEGASTLNYLRSRGWTDEEIKQAELGYISQVEATTIDAQRTIGDYYTLSIPLRSGSRLYGFKFRTIHADGHRDKYVYLQGTEKKGNLFNLTGIKQTDGDIVVVEGELDALHAQVKGISGVVATSGGQLTNELLQAALQRGIKRITLLFDKDKRGEEFVKKSVQTAYSNHVSVMVATYPDEALQDGTKIHDTDEYLKAHSPEDLKSLISNAQRSGTYLLESLINEAIEKNGGADNIKDSIERDLTREVTKLANSTPDQTERDLILSMYSNYIGNAITKEALQAVADEERAIADKLQKKQETEDAHRRADSLLKEGKVDEALSVMGEAYKSLKQIGAKEKYSSLLAMNNSESFSQRIKTRQGEIPTLYEFTSPTGEKERFTIPSGAITFVVAPTSHGKSTLLQNLALQVARWEGDGITLYFTFEEDAESVTLQLLNKYMGAELCNNYNSRQSNNLRAITHYFKTGDERFIKREQLSTFRQKKAEFFSRLYDSGKLRIFYEDYDSTELIEAIRYIASQTKVKAVFIDYIQLLSKNGNRKQRTEELKDICKDFKDLSVQTQLPIIVAAQANREVTSPLEMHSQKIAEAADLERIANKILFIWNSSFVAQKSKDSKGELETFEANKGIKLGTSGKIYAKLTKNRGGVVNIDAVLEYNGNTGVIAPNCKPVAPEQGTLNLETTETKPFDPFTKDDSNAPF